MGNKIATTDSRENVTAYIYDQLNRLIETIDPLGNSTTCGYDGNGNRTWRNDGNGATVAYAYDQLNRLTQKSLPDATTVAYAYDPNGNRTTMTDPEGTISYQYDQLNRLVEVAVNNSFGVKSITYAYDENSNRIGMTSPGYGTVQYPEYDALNRLRRIIAFAAIGFTLLGPEKYFHNEFYDAIIQERVNEIGNAYNNSKEEFIGQINQHSFRYHYYGQHLFGDPAVKLKMNRIPYRMIDGDFNGDGTSEIGIFRNGTGLWAIRGATRFYYGGSADVPVSR